MNSTMKNFLKKHYVDDTFYSHVSLLENEPGKFRFSRDNLENFWDIYCKIVVEDSDGVLGIAEKICNYMQVIADFDIKLKLTDELVIGEHLYTEKNVTDIIGMYQSVLRTILDGCTDDNLICVLLEKPIYSNTINNGKEVLTYMKNGFHLAFPNVFLKKTDVEMHLHPRLKNLLKEENVFENLGITDSSQLLDEHIVKSPWLLYGSRKSVDKDPYLITKIFNSHCEEISLERAFRYYKIYDTEETVIDINNNIAAYLPRILSINPHYRQVNEIKPGIISPLKENMINRNKNNKNKEPQQMKVSVADALKITSRLIPMLARFRCENYREWMEIGWILYNVGDGSDEALDQWINFSSNDNEKFDEDVCYTEWKKMIKKDLGLGTLKYYASIDNPESYKKFKFEEGQKSFKESIQGSHYDIAKILYSEYCTEFVCSSITNKIWYQYRNHHWEEIEEGVFLRNHISTDIVSRFTDYGHSLFSAVAASDKAEEKTFQERIKQTSKMISNLKSAPYKSCIMREAADLFFDKNFYKKLDTNPYLIAFKNGVYDLNENIFRDGKPEDYISKTMPINFVEFNETDDRIFAVHDFLEKIFPDTSVRQYFLDQASDVFLGGNQQKVVLFWTGEGDNGKSVTQNIFEKMLGEYAIKFSTTLLTGKKVANGAANPELARAGGGVRWAVLEEPDGDEEINIGYLKTLSGDDSYFVRDLFEKGKQTREIKPMFKLIFITNKLPRLKYADKATFNRIRVIPFESTFVRPGDPCPVSYEEQLREKRFPMDREFNKKIPELVEAFAWVLLKHRQNITVRIEPEKVRVATAMYQKQNDSYRQFIEEKIIEEPDRYLLLSDLNSEFQDWYKQAYPRQQIPGKNELKEYFIKLWGDLDVGLKWKGYRIKTDRDYKNATAGNDVEEDDYDNIPEM